MSKKRVPSLRHYEIHNFTASLVTNNVGVEPYQQPFDDKTLNHPTPNCDDSAQLDIVVDSGEEDLRILTLMYRYLIIWHPLIAKIQSET